MTQQHAIIGFVGLIGSGKDTAADYLVSHHNFVQDSFAKSLKDAVSAVFGWDRDMVEGKTAESRAAREVVDEWWAKRLGIPNLTPRWVLQNWGTEVCRVGFHDDIWIAGVERRLESATSNIVISDVRFPNEIQAIRQSGGKIIRIKRGDDPAWYDTAVKVNLGDISSSEMGDVHPSEYSWVGSPIDMVIHNNGTIDDLYSELNKLL